MFANLVFLPFLLFARIYLFIIQAYGFQSENNILLKSTFKKQEKHNAFPNIPEYLFQI